MTTLSETIAKRQAIRWQPGGGKEPLGPAVSAMFRAGMEIWDAFDIMRRAESVRQLERIQTAMSYRHHPCENEEEPEPEVGLPGEAPCFLDPKMEPADACLYCWGKIGEYQTIRPLLAKARRRLRAALDRRIDG